MPVLPYLGGERTPHNDADIRGAFIGHRAKDDRDQMTQAVLEGVAFAFRDSLLALNDAGTKLDRLTAIGGSSNARIWLKIIANISTYPLMCHKMVILGVPMVQHVLDVWPQQAKQ